MTGLLLDASGDIAFDDGSLLLVDGPSRLVQALGFVLQTHRGEWSPDLTHGAAWRDTVLVKAPSLPLIRAELTRVILSVEEVERIVDMALTYDAPSRRLSVRVTVATTDDTIVTTDISLDPEASAGAWLALVLL